MRPMRYKYHTHSLVFKLPLFHLFSSPFSLLCTLLSSRSHLLVPNKFFPLVAQKVKETRGRKTRFLCLSMVASPRSGIQGAAEAIGLKEGEVKGGGLLSFIGREARARCDLVQSRCGSSGNQLCAQWFCGCGILETLDLGQGYVVG